MASVFDVNIALSRLLGAFCHDIQGRTETKRCLCIPLDSLSVDNNGTVWLNISAREDSKYEGQTHSLKQKLSKAQYDELPEDESGRKVLLPFLGSIRLDKRNSANPATTYQAPAQSGNPDNDLPY